jgi:TolB-like protein/DNA-binding winged helix-turn-helix (wHTH) protein/Flp pilus assembly protein TadD
MPTSTASARIRFDAFEVDLRSAELRKYGLKVKLHQQPFQILTMLLERPGEVVTREELQRRLWPSDTFVDFDVGLNSAVKKLREALHDSAETPRFIETLPRRGYRFIGIIDTGSGQNPAAAVSNEAAKVVPGYAADEKIWKISSKAQNRWLLGTVAVVVIALGSWPLLSRWRQQTGSVAAAHIHAIAVLPLENLTGDAGEEYFVDGMTDALITDLAQISSLKVISRTSTVHYKGTKKTLPEIGRELNVDGIVTGAVVRSGERVRVDAQLIEATTDRLVWARTYERNLGDVIALQNEIARAVANEVQVKLTPRERAHLLRDESVDPQTYELYLKGRYFWSKRGEDSIRKSIDYFQQAIQRDPNYALAYAGLAEAYVVRFDVSPQEKYSAAKAAARHALEIDDSLAEAHSALAASLFWYDWDWMGAEKEFQRALALNPNYAMAHQWYGQFERAMGRENWYEEVLRAGELDPLSVLDSGGGWYRDSGQYDRALEVTRKKLELYPNSAYLHISLAKVYIRKQKYQEAIAELQKSVALSGGEPASLSELAYVYAIAGERNEALSILRQLALLSSRRYVSAFQIATIYAGLNEKDAAFRWLDKAFVEHSSDLVFLKSSLAEMDSLRADPRYTELERRVGLP